MMRNGIFGGRQWRLLAALCCATLSSGGAVADDDKAIGKQAFEKACIACHSEPAVPRALPRDQLARMAPELIFAAQLGARYLFWGPMERSAYGGEDQAWRFTHRIRESYDFELYDLDTPALPVDDAAY